MMAGDTLEKPSILPPDFQQAAQPPQLTEPPPVTVSMGIDADILAYFQSETEPSDWQRHMNGVLRFYMETNQVMQADMELAAQQEATSPVYAPKPG